MDELKTSLSSAAVTPMRLFTCCLWASVAGFVLFVLPESLNGGYNRSLFSLTHAAVKQMAWGQFILLFAGGALFRVFLKPPVPLLISLCFMSIFPFLAIIEMIRDSSSHNLWPFEFLIYALVGIIPYLGMLSVSLLKKLRPKR